MPKNLPVARAEGPPLGRDPSKMEGLVVDDLDAKIAGKWTPGTGLKGFVGNGYLYAPDGSGASVRFEFNSPADGLYEFRLIYGNHENRGASVPVTWGAGERRQKTTVDMREKPPLKGSAIALGKLKLRKGDKCFVEVTTKNAKGLAHVDAVQLIAAP